MDTKSKLVLVASVSLAAACTEAPSAPAPHSAVPVLAAGGATYTAGEQQPSVDLTLGPWGLYPVGEGQNLTQTFTPIDNAWLGFLQLPIGCTAGTMLNVIVRDGLNGNILYDVVVTGLPQTVGGTFQTIQVFDPAATAHGMKLHKDHEYAFELAAFAGPGSPTPATCGIARGPTGDSYPRGRGFYMDASVGITSYVPLPNGAATDNEDLPFITLVR